LSFSVLLLPRVIMQILRERDLTSRVLTARKHQAGIMGKAPRRIWLVGLLVPYWSWRRSGDDRLRDIGHAVHFCRAGACPAAEVRASASVSAARRLAGAWFSGPECAPLHPAGVTDMFELIAYGCGLPPVRLHGTRARTEPAARQNGQHKKKARGRNPRSGRVCRQGLEPRTRGLKSLLLGSSNLAVYQHLHTSTLARRPQPAEAEIPSTDGRYRVVPGCPSEHGANIDPGRSRPLPGRVVTVPGRRSICRGGSAGETGPGAGHGEYLSQRGRQGTASHGPLQRRRVSWTIGIPAVYLA
jgi:hypothetical protein